MNYYFYNNDATSLFGDNRTHILLEQGYAITGGPRDFGKQLAKLLPDDILLMYENKKGVVAVGNVLEPWDKQGYKTPIYYVQGKSFWSPELEYRIKVNWFLDLTKAPISVAEIRDKIGYQPRGAVKIIKKWRATVEDMIALRSTQLLSPIPEEIEETQQQYFEGAKKTVIVNAYERYPAARIHCISHWGYQCQACGVILKNTYGDIASEFIQVHHLTPIHQLGQEYALNPIDDMRPVCPNCHAMLHRRTPPFSIQELKNKIINGQQAVAEAPPKGDGPMTRDVWANEDRRNRDG